MLAKCLMLLFFASLIEADYYRYPSDMYPARSCALPSLDHGRVRVKKQSRLARFSCMPHYELVGNRYATCRAGRWDVPLPICVRPGCPDLPVELNAVRVRENLDAYVVTFCLSGYELIGSQVVYCDGRKWNGTAPRCVESASAVPSLSCDFETDLCGWTHDELHDFDWLRWNTKTPSSFLYTGPSYDHTLGEGKRGYYMYIESTSRRANSTARLLSPVYNASLSLDGCFTFYYHMFGKDIGGLRVYQLPVSAMPSVLAVYTNVSKQYQLFEKWGNLGDTWFNAALTLRNLTEDFQIVIEGIRGSSYTSDVAFDDVAILQGENCTVLQEAIPTASYEWDSCVGRCVPLVVTADGRNFTRAVTSQCHCSPYCLLDDNCCGDFMEACIYSSNLTNSDYDDDLPQTQKLVSESTNTSTTPQSTPTTLRLTTQKLTSRNPTTTVASTTQKPTTTTQKPTTTTQKPTTTTQKPTTTTQKGTTRKVTTQKTRATTTRFSVKTTSTVTPTKKVVTSTEKVATTRSNSKSASDDINLEKKKEEAEADLQKMKNVKSISSKSSPWKGGLIGVACILLAGGLVLVAVRMRGARGRQLLSGVRARVAGDAEVRYLNCDQDDGL